MSYFQRHKRRSMLLAIPAGLILTAFVAVFAFAPTNSYNAAPQKPFTNLPVVGSMENLKQLLQEVKNYENDVVVEDSVQLEKTKEANVRQSSDFSETNVQVSGVDEADLVKTDGNYIYKVNQAKVIIIKAKPAEQMQVVSRINFANDFRAQELHLYGNYLVAIGTSSFSPPARLRSMNKMKANIYPPPHYNLKKTKAIVYNIENRNQPEKIREVELDGKYLSSRRINSSLYLVSNKPINYYQLEDDSMLLPSYRDTASGSEIKRVGCENIRYFPDKIYPAYIMIAGFDIEKPEKAADIQTYLGNGENIYTSTKNLYVAVSGYQQMPVVIQEQFNGVAPEIGQTFIYKFALSKGQVYYTGKGAVPGTILNQFSMDEHQNYFRIATTSGDIWRNDRNTSQNNVYIMDKDLTITGKLENIAPGEKIYATRFMGDRAYMVTFRQVDPFFVIDLANPVKPQILGKLKIPGYSDYLHPYDANHIIGFGKDTIEDKGWNGEPQAYDQGMKVALFDVTDVNNPVEMYKTVIGTRGTNSELLQNHKALLFSREKNLLAFPVTVMEQQSSGNSNSNIPKRGSFAFQGAYVYNLDLVNGFQLKGRITHLTPDDYQRAGDYWHYSDKNVERILYSGATLYTLSRNTIKAHTLPDLKYINSVNLSL
ncbi:MAG: beta-propeller domain-containing protein [Syntrophomonadaceae bacterium]|nr:beta-propeller domain-containing protein [Syntrophomonadaceae bacterium]MDD3890131.1 beta-propeller domain-containing protein [Syntrophomonadaceae bacterium]MDD4548335.1 beta-propeller domain-containing protein [Syntrophomonadaceae bacterium]